MPVRRPAEGGLDSSSIQSNKHYLDRLGIALLFLLVRPPDARHTVETCLCMYD